MLILFHYITSFDNNRSVKRYGIYEPRIQEMTISIVIDIIYRFNGVVFETRRRTDMLLSAPCKNIVEHCII